MHDSVEGAKRLLRDGQPLRAVEVLYQWIEEHPDDAAAWSVLAGALYELDSYAAAINVAEQAAQLRPQSARNWCNLGMLLRKVGRPREAERVLYRALTIDSSHERARKELHKIHELMTGGLRPGARDAATDDAEACEPARSPVEDAKLFVRAGQPLLAAELLEPWLEAYPDDADAWSAMAAARHGLESREAALEAAERAVQLRPSSARNWCNLGMMLRKLGRLYEAEKALYRALGLNSSYDRARTELRKIHEIRIGDRHADDHAEPR